MNLITVLRKLGILRFGAQSGTYTNRQMEAIVDRGDTHYYLIAYAAPPKLFTKYSFVISHLLGTLRFGEF